MLATSDQATAQPTRTRSGPVRLAVVNDYEVIVSGVSAMLQPFADRVEVIELDVAADPEQPVDVALFDTYGQSGIGLKRIRSLVEHPGVDAVVLYTWTLSGEGHRAAFQAGVRAVVAKSLSAESLVEALEAVAGGEVVDTGGFRTGAGGMWPGAQWGLTVRESETLALLSTGMTNRSISEALFVSENTVRTHLKAVFRKLGVTNRSQAVARALGDPSFAIHRPRTVVAD